jgi:hypothetical protein
MGRTLLNSTLEYRPSACSSALITRINQPITVRQGKEMSNPIVKHDDATLSDRRIKAANRTHFQLAKSPEKISQGER